MAKYGDDKYTGDTLYPAYKSINDWLATYFNIDLKLIEQEKREMLTYIHGQNAEHEASEKHGKT